LLSLDFSHQQAVSELIDARRRDSGTAVVVVTHEINPILAYVDRVLYLVGGPLGGRRLIPARPRAHGNGRGPGRRHAAADGGILASLASTTVKPSVFVTSISFGIYLVSRVGGPRVARHGVDMPDTDMVASA
jgi:energy-coupling factor transporter ATP-binding protein EcfA2